MLMGRPWLLTRSNGYSVYVKSVISDKSWSVIWNKTRTSSDIASFLPRERISPTTDYSK